MSWIVSSYLPQDALSHEMPHSKGLIRLLLGTFLICTKPKQFNPCHSINVVLQCIFSRLLFIIKYTHSSLISSSSQFSQRRNIYCLCKTDLRAGIYKCLPRLLVAFKNLSVMKFHYEFMPKHCYF